MRYQSLAGGGQSESPRGTIPQVESKSPSMPNDMMMTKEDNP